MARRETLVQLSDEMLAELDARVEREHRGGRSELIREAIDRYLGEESAVDRAIVEGYTRVPPAEAFGAPAVVRASIEAEPWDDLDAPAPGSGT